MLNSPQNPPWSGVTAQQSDSAQACARPTRTPGSHILVVDDDWPTLALTKEILEDAGFEVTAKGDSLQALKLFFACSTKFDIVITDHHMPNMTGLCLAHEMLGVRSDVPIILCSGDDQAVLLAQKQLAGHHKVMHKPVSRHELMSTIHGMLDGVGPGENRAGK